LSNTQIIVDGLRRQTVTAAGITNFIWDGQDVLVETDDGGTIRRPPTL